MIKNEIINAFHEIFGFIEDKFEIMELLPNGKKIDYEEINKIKLPSDEYNIVWHPGVYLFIGNNKMYRAGVSMRNSRNRVLEHIYQGTEASGYRIWDIDQYDDRSIMLFNIKDPSESYWLLALELFFEERFKPLIKARRKG